MKIQEGLKRRGELIDRMKQILARADRENRDLSTAEESDFVALEAELGPINQTISRRRFVEQQDAWLSAPRSTIQLREIRREDTHPDGLPGPRNTSSASRWKNPKTGEEIRCLTHDEPLADPNAPCTFNFGDLVRALTLGPKSESEKRALGEATIGAGGALVPSPLSEQLIDALRAQSVVFDLGARTIPMSSKTLDIARIITDPVAAWRDENASVAETNVVFDRLTFTAKTMSFLVKASRELIEDAPNLDFEMRQLFGRIGALELDKAALAGVSGPGSPASPVITGLLTLSGVNEQNGSGGLSNYDLILDNLQQILEDNAPFPGGMAIDPQTFVSLAKLKEASTSRSFTYSSLNRLLTANNPESGLASYSYDDAGNLVSRAMGGKTVCYGTWNGSTCNATGGYDDLNRLLKKTYSDGTLQVDFTYDIHDAANKPASCSGDDGPKGQLVKVANSVSTNYYFYGRLGYTVCSRQTTGTNPPFDFLYTNSPQGERKTIVYPSGRTVNNTLDDAGRITAVAATANYATGIQYAAHGAVTQLTLGNGIFEKADYNWALQLTDLKLGSAAGTSDRWRLQNGYPSTGNNGNILSQTLTVLNSTAITTQYRYDVANRLQLANEDPTNPTTPACPDAGSNWCQQYSYDARGNRLVAQESNLGFPIGRPDAFGTDNRITTAGFGYDAAGNLNLIPTGERYAYDAENRQVGHCTLDSSSCPTEPGAGRTQYGYDGEGQRVTKASQTGGTIVYVYDAQGRLAAEYGGTAVGSGVQYLTADHLGSIRVITDPSKAVLECDDYLPFGDEILATSQNGRNGIACYAGETGLHQKFTGKERDSESRLDYFGARYHSWAQGRFMSPDPGAFDVRNPQSLNRYVYALNNPLFYIDPDGAESIAATYMLGTFSVRTFRSTGRRLDPAELLTRGRGPAHVPLRDLRSGQPMITQGESSSGDGCPFGCYAEFYEVPMGYSIKLGFRYDDDTGELLGANIERTVNPNAAFIGPRERTTAWFAVPFGGAQPGPADLAVHINTFVIRGLTSQELRALYVWTVGKTDLLSRRMAEAVLDEQRRRAEEEERRRREELKRCQQKTDDKCRQ